MLVGICAERGVALGAGVLAVLKAGAAYVPFEPSLPGAPYSMIAGPRSVRENREVLGLSFTPQDGNSLLSSLAAAEWS